MFEARRYTAAAQARGQAEAQRVIGVRLRFVIEALTFNKPQPEFSPRTRFPIIDLLKSLCQSISHIVCTRLAKQVLTPAQGSRHLTILIIVQIAPTPELCAEFLRNVVRPSGPPFVVLIFPQVLDTEAECGILVPAFNKPGTRH